ncbi:unnamed protein product, partial [Urochloa humidicola]
GAAAAFDLGMVPCRPASTAQPAEEGGTAVVRSASPLTGMEAERPRPAHRLARCPAPPPRSSPRLPITGPSSSPSRFPHDSMRRLGAARRPRARGTEKASARKSSAAGCCHLVSGRAEPRRPRRRSWMASSGARRGWGWLLAAGGGAGEDGGARAEDACGGAGRM